MDTVIGKIDEPKCMLTLLWRKSHFMIIMLLQNKTTAQVTNAFEYLRSIIPVDIYKKFLVRYAYLFQSVLPVHSD